MDDLVPKDHLLRKIDAAVDFTKIYDIVGKLYCESNGRPSTDPVVLFKTAIIQHIYGIPSLRRTAEEISLNIAYRWFLGYSLTEKTPHFSPSRARCTSNSSCTKTVLKHIWADYLELASLLYYPVPLDFSSNSKSHLPLFVKGGFFDKLKLRLLLQPEFYYKVSEPCWIS